ncbi:tetratricopeptide repeat protein [Winogradskyella vincentii]|uniref:Tetratricopeptide repeat-containing protein n=1 Tax=Winogradskyella vincentii TaxID=2877122 RepID=A0ABS7XZY1_9FLAO|nr:hypothetical protein [Winogradskyella vincentii]MCA0153219.1 hypothetical protein [Winogradskyella vincentii]
MFRKSLLILFSIFVGINANAHGDLHKRILKVTEEIKQYPDSSYLYFKRGELYFQHNNFIKSHKDLMTSKRLGDDGDDVQFLLAKCNFELKKYRSSKRLVDKLIRKQPKNPVVIRLLADIYFERKKFIKSAEAYEDVIKYSNVTYPEYYIYASKAWYSTNSEEGVIKAQMILYQGIESLGNIMVLYNQLVSNYINFGDYSKAAEVQLKVIEISPRKERTYLKLACIQEMQKEYADAIISLKYAITHYESLPYRIKNAKFMKEFYSELNLKKQNLERKI